MLALPTPPTSNHPHTPLPNARATIVYTETDEAPALATYNLLPIFSKFASVASVDIVPCDISLSGRVLATFPEYLKEHQRVADNLAYLGELCQTSDPPPTIIKLPTISASIPQLQACIQELRIKGYDVPLYPSEPADDTEREIQKRYAKVLGSAVNPVIRQGNSDRHASSVVKLDAQKNPSQEMKFWSKASRTHVAHMMQGDFYENEQSVVVSEPTSVAIELIDKGGQVKVLKEEINLTPGEVIDSSLMDAEELCKYFEREMQDAKDTSILLSLHLKATMMKISDPIIFGHALKTYFRSAWMKHGAVLEQIGANANHGLSSIFDVLDKKLPKTKAREIREDFEKCYEERPWLAMTDSDKGITNLHVPSNVIIDNSMPIVIRDGGKMWNMLGKLEDTKCLIPDRSYGPVYQEMISYVKTNGQFDCATMGNVSNVGLMAMKAEEYGSHDKTFEISQDGVVRVRDRKNNEVYMEHTVRKGDIWRMCQTMDVAVQDWVKLAVTRARETRAKTIFWLDPDRAHDRQILEKVHMYLKDHDTSNLDIGIMRPTHAMRETMERTTAGLDTVSVTGNVLRDYLTDLFPILEMGTSAKLLSIVSLLAGGMLYETGAGGSAPKHVEQFKNCDHLRWNSLGEYQAMAEAFRRLGLHLGDEKVKMLGDRLYKAIGVIMEKHEMPERRVHEIDNRDTNFFIALHWAEFLSKEDERYAAIFRKLSEGKESILEEIRSSQGEAVDLGGYYLYEFDKARRAMNPSATLCEILAQDTP